MQTQTHIADRVRHHMRQRGLTQLDLAVTLGLTRQSISNRLLGRVEWKVSELQAIAPLLAVDLNALIDGTAA